MPSRSVSYQSEVCSDVRGLPGWRDRGDDVAHEENKRIGQGYTRGACLLTNACAHMRSCLSPELFTVSLTVQARGGGEP